MNMPWKAPRAAEPGPTLVVGKPLSEADNIKVAIDQLARVRADKDALEKLEDKLKEQLETLGVGDHAGYKVKLVITESYPKRFDGKAFEADHPEVYAAYKRKADKPQRTLSIKALI